MDLSTAFRRTRRSRPRLFWLSAVTLASLLVFPAVEIALQSANLVPGFTFYDFRGAFYTAGERFLSGKNLYADVHNPYVYPPVVVLLFAPFTVVSPWMAGLLWNVFSLAVLGAGLFALVRSFGVRLSIPLRVVLLWALVGFFPTILWLKAGQVSGFLTGLFCFAVAAHRRSWQDDDSTTLALASGALTTISSSFKPFYAPSGAHLLRDKKRFVGAVAAVVGIVGLSLFFGVETFTDYLSVLTHGKGWGQATEPGGISTDITNWGPFFFRPLYFFGSAALYIRLALTFGVAGLVLYSRRDDSARSEYAALALGLTTIPLASPIPDLFAVTPLIPAFIVSLFNELQLDDGLPEIPVLSVLLFHVHAYTLGFFAGFGATIIPAVSALEPLLPFLQAGMWALALMFGLQVYRIGQSVRA
ncbi:glycosyltransferase family 87 protein [Halogeometricum borinquense]|uniref:glycosyltransferase family 87 protein n=1 Tax=Halogeometricum borinquense TaxID=60847 RepID=UPI003413F334